MSRCVLAVVTIPRSERVFLRCNGCRLRAATVYVQPFDAVAPEKMCDRCATDVLVQGLEASIVLRWAQDRTPPELVAS